LYKQFFMVEIFKTNVQGEDESKNIIHQLLEHFKEYKINFDLEDCDKILRVEGKDIPSLKIIQVVTTQGYQCKVLN
jgi:hypothetical protein